MRSRPLNQPHGKPRPLTFRFATAAEETRFFAALAIQRATQTLILRTLALTWIEHVEKHGALSFPVRLIEETPHRCPAIAKKRK